MKTHGPLCQFAATALLLFGAGLQLNAALNDGLVASYKFNGNAADSSGFGNHGVIAGAGFTSDRYGSLNAACVFDGTNDYIEVPDSNSLHLNDMTLSAWVRCEGSVTGWAGIIVKAHASRQTTDVVGAQINVVNQRLACEVFPIGSSQAQLYGPRQINDGQWHLVTAVVDRAVGTVFIYLDAGLETKQQFNWLPAAALHNTVPLLIGVDRERAWFYRGAIDDVRIYSRALSAAEVAALYSDTSEMPGVVTGRVAGGGAGWLSGATVSAWQYGHSVLADETDDQGRFELTGLPAGTYELRVRKSGFVSRHTYPVDIRAGGTNTQLFSLVGMPAAPIIDLVTRLPEAIYWPTEGSLQYYSPVDHAFYTITKPNQVDLQKPTVVFTHGWNSDPNVWARDMAEAMSEAGTDANLLAWDWSGPGGAETDALLSLAHSRTPEQGRGLGKALHGLLGSSYQQGMHFVGHSLGTLVNATAADYLHEKTGGAFDWRKTQLTLLDQAQAANVEGRLIGVGASTVGGLYALLGLSDAPSTGWVSPIPRQSAWVDNYISLVGWPVSGAVNVLLSSQASHGYACEWYTKSALHPTNGIGHRFSFERLGLGDIFPSPVPYSLGSVLVQSPTDEMSTFIAPDAAAASYRFATDVSRATGRLLPGVGASATVVQAVGKVALDVVESEVVTSLAKESTSWVLATVLPSFQTILQSTGHAGVLEYSPSAIWLPITVPTNAALFAFDFRMDGEPAEDVLSVSMAGTNLFVLGCQDMPTNQVLNSGPIDVTRFAGQTVELFLGLLGGTSTNATVTVEGLRFYSIEPPVMAVVSTQGQVQISWPASVSGYSLVSADAATASSWLAVTNAPVLQGARQTVTVPVEPAATRFFRLKRE